jgi:hypothetical protein
VSDTGIVGGNRGFKNGRKEAPTFAQNPAVSLSISQLIL